MLIEWITWITHWALALVKGIREPHEVKKKPLDLGGLTPSGLWFKLWFNLTHDRCQNMWQVTWRSQSQTRETHKQCRTTYQGQSLLPCLRRSKGLSTRLLRVSQSHQLARPLPQVQPPSPQRAPLRLRLLKSYVNVLACKTIMLHFSGDSSGFK